MRDVESLDPDMLLREQDAARILGITPRCLEAWRTRGGGPPFRRLSPRLIRYHRGELLRWSEERGASSTAEYGGRRHEGEMGSVEGVEAALALALRRCAAEGGLERLEAVLEEGLVDVRQLRGAGR